MGQKKIYQNFRFFMSADLSNKISDSAHFMNLLSNQSSDIISLLRVI